MSAVQQQTVKCGFMLFHFYAVMRCPSVCLSVCPSVCHVRGSCQNE